MIENKRILAIIPARAGSKRLPNKNKLNLAGKPLIAWTIEAATESAYIDEIVVSSDCDELLDIAASYGSKICKRPSSLATDTSSTSDTIFHVLDIYKNNCNSFDIVIILQPTSPLRTYTDIDEALISLLQKKGGGVISVCPCEHNPLWSNILPKNQTLNKFIPPKIKNKRSQDLPNYYRLNGALFIFYIDLFYNYGGIFYTNAVYAHIMSNLSSVDIDTEFDFNFARFLIDHNMVSNNFNKVEK